MEQEKELLLKDLCTRLPYGVKGVYQWKGNEPYDRELTGMLLDELLTSLNDYGDTTFTPYLLPMSSMTIQEKDYYNWMMENRDNSWLVVDWLNKNFFDYRGLINKGLAIGVTDENNPYKNE